jgi:hypothetical protein
MSNRQLDSNWKGINLENPEGLVAYSRHFLNFDTVTYSGFTV